MKKQVKSFNPAEAEEGFSSQRSSIYYGEEAGFNPAEAEEGFSRGQNYTEKDKIAELFQSSRSRRRV